MGFSLLRINKYLSWLVSAQKQYKDNSRISKQYADICRRFSWAILLKRPQNQIDKIASEKNEWVLNYVAERIPHTLKKYENYPTPANILEPQKTIKVWSMFWQGEENAPELFKLCLNSARKQTGYDVVVLSEKNYQQYIEIPEYMLEKYRQGKIIIQHICDYMVVSVLASHGGYFTGATVWNSQRIPECVLRAPFFSPAAKTNSPFFMSKCRWTGYVLGGNKEFPLYHFAVDALQEYWKNNDIAVDYLLLDYIFELACRTMPCVADVINHLPDNNLLRNELIGILSNPYDKELMKKYTKGDTFLYKLSWKFGRKEKTTQEGKETIYGHMIKESSIY